MVYVNQTMQEYWEHQGIDWQQISLANLHRASADFPYTHEFRRDNGELYAVALMHSDGYGPSRLLLGGYFAELFPQGYKVALPEMSMGVVWALELQSQEQQELESLIQSCHENGTRPLLPGIHHPDALQPLNL
jgi:hypothetical protein